LDGFYKAILIGLFFVYCSSYSSKIFPKRISSICNLKTVFWATWS